MSELAEHLAALTSNRDRDVLDITLVGVLRDLLRQRRVAIFRFLGEGTDRRCVMRASLRQGEVVASADPAWVDIESLPRLAAYPARSEAMTAGRMVVTAGEASHLSVFPLATNGEIVGVLEIETDSVLDSSAQRLIGGILRIFSNFQSLLDYSERDGLTGLLNRKTFDEGFWRFASLLSSGSTAGDDGRRRTGLGNRCWLGMIDIDHFKSVNDNFGHLIGDEVLLLLSRLMANSFRYHDTLYRFGGEEFIVLMRGTEERDIAYALDRLRRRIETYAFPQVGCISISASFTELRAGDSPGNALARADEAIYYAKTHGRNQVSNYAELVLRGELAIADKVGAVELFPHRRSAKRTDLVR